MRDIPKTHEKSRHIFFNTDCPWPYNVIFNIQTTYYGLWKILVGLITPIVYEIS